MAKNVRKFVAKTVPQEFHCHDRVFYADHGAKDKGTIIEIWPIYKKGRDHALVSPRECIGWWYLVVWDNGDASDMYRAQQLELVSNIEISA